MNSEPWFSALIDAQYDDRVRTVRRMTKREAGLRLAIIAAEIRLTLDEEDADCPTWADDIDVISAVLNPGGGE